MKRVSDAGANIIDVVCYPFITDVDKVLADPAAARAKAGQGRAALHANYGAEAFWKKLQTEIAAIDAARI